MRSAFAPVKKIIQIVWASPSGGRFTHIIVHPVGPISDLLFAKSRKCSLTPDQSSKGSKQVALQTGANSLNFNDSSKVAKVAGSSAQGAELIMTAGRLDTPRTRG